GRAPADWEVNFWVDHLATDMTAEQVAYGFAASAEREGQRVQQDYQTYLGRSASQEEVDFWVNQFAAHGLSNEEVQANFVGSPEYFASAQKGAGSRAAWVAVAYADVLHRTASQDEIAFWVSVMT